MTSTAGWGQAPRTLLQDGGARRSPWTGAVVAAVLGLTVVGAALRFYGLGHQGLWYDESDTALLMHFSAGRMVGLIPQIESTPPLYYCVLWVWVRIFGDDPTGLRSLSALAGTLTIPVAYATAAELVSRRAGVICAALTACNPFLVWYSQEARAYELLALLSAASLLAFARVREHPTPRRTVAWVLAGGLALTTHYYAAVLLVPEAVVLLAVHGRGRAVRLGVAALAAWGAALVPLALTQNGRGNTAWIARAPLQPRLAQIIPQFLIGTDAPDRVVVKFAAFALALVALLALAALAVTRREQWRGAALAGGLAVAGFAITLILVAVGYDDLITRNLLALWLPAAIAVSGGLASLSAGRIGTLAAAALCAIGLVGVVGVAADARFQRPDWPAVARALGTRPARGQARAILIQRYRTLLPLSLYLPGLRILRTPARITQLDVIAMHSPGQPLCWWGAECNLISSPLQRRYRIAGLRVVGERHVRQFSILELRARGPLRLTRSTVSHALSATQLSHDKLMVQSGP